MDYSSDCSTIKGETIWGWGGEDTSFNTTHISFPGGMSAVEAHQQVLQEEREYEEELALNKMEMNEHDLDDLQIAWKARQRKLNTDKTQKYIDTLLKWILDNGEKQSIIRKLRTAIATAAHKRDLKVDILAYNLDATVTHDNVSYRVDWIILHTNALTQIAKAFNPTHFSVNRVKTYNSATECTYATLVLKFWP